MFKEKDMMFLYAETSVHPGSGSGVGFIDLPLQRERFTGLPIIQASGMKGAIREYFEYQPAARDTGNNIIPQILEAFGPTPGPDASEHAGALSMGDARVLLFPVRSLYGVFAYLTCPLVLERFKRDLEVVWPSAPWTETIPEPDPDAITVVSAVDKDKTIIAQGPDDKSLQAVFDEYALSATTSKEARQIAEFIRDYCFPAGDVYKTWRDNLPSRFAIIPDEMFVDFTRLGAEVITRNRIGATGTVEEGGLWTEELIPSETLLYSTLLAADPLIDTTKHQKALADAAAVKNFIKSGLKAPSIMGLDNQRLHIGGDQTVGRGVVMAHFLSQGGRK